MPIENSNSASASLAATSFEDIIDGYFPLQESLRQMLVRNDFVTAYVTLTHAPIMNIPGLAQNAPVPLRIACGAVGVAERLDLIVALYGQELRVIGYGRWRWHSDSAGSDRLMAPSTRLAEPAIVKGIGAVAGHFQTDKFVGGALWQENDFIVFRIM